jgi:PPOX class probable F420-dependent enzyme
MKLVPESYQDLLRDETKALAHLGTIMPDGSPQVTPVWFSVDGETIMINSAEGRVKDRNMRARPKVALAILDPSNPYRYMQIRGRVVEITREGADAHIDALALKYTGNPVYQGRKPGMVRVIYKIQPESVTAQG